MDLQDESFEIREGGEEEDGEDLRFEQELEGVMSLNDFMKAVDAFETGVAARCVNLGLVSGVASDGTTSFDSPDPLFQNEGCCDGFDCFQNEVANDDLFFMEGRES